jgi:hypothetical protein
MAGKLKTGSEKFTSQGSDLPANLLDFWQWSSSDLLSNALRGVLTEFIVSMALGISIDKPREEWAAYDLVTNEGIKVEVKSAAYVQSWKQTKPSKISFSIRKTTGYDEDGIPIGESPRRQAAVYVFCLLAVEDGLKVDPMNLDQWEFYVLSSKEIEQHWGGHASVSLGPLKKVCGEGIEFEKIKSKIDEIQK